MDTNEWDVNIDAWYEANADESRPAASVAAMRELLSGHPNAGALASFELASIHDSMGFTTEAVPLYRQSLTEGLDADHAARARIQLASTLRNLGQFDEAIALLREPSGTDLDASRRAFLALALHSAGRHDEAVREALEALIPSLPRYRRSLSGYAAELTAKS